MAARGKPFSGKKKKVPKSPCKKVVLAR